MARRLVADLFVGLWSRPRLFAIGLLTAATAAGLLVGLVHIQKSASDDLLQRLDALGADVLVASPGPSVAGDEPPAPLPGATHRATAIAGTEGAVLLATSDRLVARPGPLGPAPVIQVPLVGLESSGRLRAAEVVDGEGRLDPTLPFALVGPRAAEVLGIDAYPAIVYVADTPFVVTGEVAGDPLISELRRGLIVSATYAQDHFEGLATTLYVRTARSVSFDEVAAAANPAAPSGISVQRPRQLIEARSRADQSLGALTNVVLVSAYVAAGLVLTLTLVSSIRQRTAEFGIRRCLGATGGQVVLLAGGEAIFIGLIGSIIGVSAGLAAALGWALHNSWPYEVSATQLVSALAFSGLVSAFAAMPPALVASRLDPVQAVTTDV